MHAGNILPGSYHEPAAVLGDGVAVEVGEGVRRRRKKNSSLKGLIV